MSDNYFVKKYGAQQPPADPTFEYKGPAAKADLTGKNLGNAKTAQELELDRKKFTLDQQKYALDQEKAGREASGISPAYLEAQRLRKESLPVIDQQLAEFRDIYGQYFKGAGGSSRRGRLAEIMPSKILGRTVNEANAQMDNVGSRLGAMFKPLIAPGSKDADAASEYEKKVIPFLPRAGDSDAELEKKYATLYALRNQMAGTPLKSAPRKQKQSTVIDFNDWGK